MASYHPANFSGLKHCVKGDIMLLIVTWFSNITLPKKPCDSINRSTLRQVNTLPSLASIGTVKVEILWSQFVPGFFKTTWSKIHMTLSVGIPQYKTRWYCRSRDVMVLVCNVISQDNLIEGSCDFWLSIAHQGKLISCKVRWF